MQNSTVGTTILTAKPDDAVWRVEASDMVFHAPLEEPGIIDPA